ncbi:5-(carboxyamino)imidazole ribonucleotide synthase [Halothiobacillus sp.]|uniref:5-(carboxyamino)imidazole ribonucleotide synthase n=1 Tax=Halothiobacillus sp. TaxID=1891311 RepID=UPI0026125C57|nr:5-(carboxyamino)imidazole ribonucleotide synthase [Halothiobacillus sp.]MDD4966694.1 5-(carboxyamino)imidazole ribonucleotide synthase [Halothiobacillus sp.]
MRTPSPDPTSDQAHIGVIGAGQLGQMLALAGISLGLRFTFLDPSPEAPAGRLGRHIRAEYDDELALEQLAVECDVITLEFENVPVSAVASVERHNQIHPGGQPLSVAQDRVHEKQYFESLGIPVARYRAIDSFEDLQSAIADIGYPCILKTRRLGYDGKGQVIIRSGGDLEPAWEAIGGNPSILEQMIPFTREVSIISVRSTRGEVAFYPVSENQHRSGILYRTEIHTDDPAQAKAQEYARHVLDGLDYVGVLAIEFFEYEGQLIANEMAPRVHNSGHWSQNGAVTSQFENHLRAILGWPLGSTACTGYSIMLNLVGSIPPRAPILALPGVHLHDYGKETRTGRKLGHVNVVADTKETCRKYAALIEQMIG